MFSSEHVWVTVEEIAESNEKKLPTASQTSVAIGVETGSGVVPVGQIVFTSPVINEFVVAVDGATAPATAIPYWAHAWALVNPATGAPVTEAVPSEL
jgi:hypothetical protein